MERLNIDEAIMHAREVARERKNHATYTFPSLKTYYDECEKSAEEHEQLAKWLEELKHYKVLEEQDRLIELPCAVGETVYVKLASYCNLPYAEAEVRDFTHFTSCGFCVVVTSKHFDKQSIPFSEFGKTVFTTKEEAEAKLKERGAE